MSILIKPTVLASAAFMLFAAAAPLMAAPGHVATDVVSGVTMVRHGHGGHGFRGHHGRHFRGFGYGYGFYDYGNSGCGWLRARAIETGSRYWWRRYRACIEGW